MRSSDHLQSAKGFVLDHHRGMDEVLAGPPVKDGRVTVDRIAEVMAKHMADTYQWRGVHPFHQLDGIEAAAGQFWGPLHQAFGPIQRRPDVFLAGANDVDVDRNDDSVWVCEMGHFLGLFDHPWLDIPPTGRMCFVRYVQFHCVEGELIVESAMFVDVISVMDQAGHYPLPPQTGASHIYPGPRTHDGLLFDVSNPDESRKTMDLVNSMVADLTEANKVAAAGGGDLMDRSVLARSWTPDMIWSGPTGIGASYTIDRYQHQHQYPFRFGLTDKTFNGHVARFAEGNYACFFGWPNLTNTASGGFLGLPAGPGPADMRVVDVYRRQGDRLAENWVFMDLPHRLATQGLDVLARMRQLVGIDGFDDN